MEAKHNLCFYQNSMHKSVGSAESVHDLKYILQIIPLANIKHFIDQQIDELDLNSCKNFYWTQISIDEIFPEDIMQYILSFSGFHHTKAVSTKWNQYSDKNEKHHLTKLYDPINKFKSPIKYDENINQTYIIDKNRKKLHHIEIEYGYKGPMQNIEDVFEICNVGDRVLIYDGLYNLSHIKSDLSIQLIGVGDDVTIKSDGSYDPFWSVSHDITTTKCKFDFSEQIGAGCICVHENVTLWMENCELSLNNTADLGWGLWATQISCLNVTNCKFINSSGVDTVITAIELSPFAKGVNISDCVFKHCGITIDDAYDDPNGVNDEMLQLKCVGNIFDMSNNNSSCDDVQPIKELVLGSLNMNHHYSRHSDRYILSNNLLKGYNPTKMISENDKVDPNKIKVHFK